MAAALPRAAAAAAAEAPKARRLAWPATQPTPVLALPAWEGRDWSLAQARGQVVLLNFWATWCGPCRNEMPSLELLAQRHEREGLQVLAVNFRETDAVIRRFLGEWPLSLPVLRDHDGAATRSWQVRIFPSTVVVARSGRAAFTVVGDLDWMGPTARQWLAPLL